MTTMSPTVNYYTNPNAFSQHMDWRVLLQTCLEGHETKVWYCFDITIAKGSRVSTAQFEDLSRRKARAARNRGRRKKKKKTEQKIQQHSVPVGPKPELTDQLSTGGDDDDPDSSLRRRRRRSSAVFGSPSPTACSSIPSVSPSPSEAVSVETSGGDEAAAPFTGTKTKTMNR